MNLPSLFSNERNHLTSGIPSLFEVLRGWPEGDNRISVDVEETAENYKVSANVPGAKKENIDIALTDGMLSIQVNETKESEKKEGSYLVKERSFETSGRTVSLPYAMTGDKVDAELKDGVLYITVPKCEEKKSRKIRIK